MVLKHTLNAVDVCSTSFKDSAKLSLSEALLYLQILPRELPPRVRLEH